MSFEAKPGKPPIVGLAARSADYSLTRDSIPNFSPLVKGNRGISGENPVNNRGTIFEQTVTVLPNRIEYRQKDAGIKNEDTALCTVSPLS